MATPVESQTHVIVEASKPRAWLAVALALGCPVLFALALLPSGHTVSDYPNLVANGQLPLVRQIGMWVGYALLLAVYVPPALRALSSPVYLASTATELIAPSGEQFDLAKVTSIGVEKTFWHKVLIVQSSDETRRVIVTFAKPLAPGIRDALEADSNLKGIPIS